MATDTPTTGRDSDKFMLRLPDGMRDRLKEVAKSNNRTLNAEIVARLDESFHKSGLKLTSPTHQTLRKVMERAGITEEEALERLVLQGYASLENRNVLVVRTTADATLDDMIRMMKAAKNFLPDISEAYIEKD
ncbi:Arc family DNA-binding protein [Comamonas sp. CMM02]|uniref:Arc family DNA-binding protein n=1 Tax=Comamonas sp. CMM02 TaxID=2769307 RepID=UPI0017875464|nr:Arc family DNA-binding protein [Comamonas sp. CMM02]MBD9402096.1 Arc family DNA-binding protein [Comamonas sp. CMM02]